MRLKANTQEPQEIIQESAQTLQLRLTPQLVNDGEFASQPWQYVGPDSTGSVARRCSDIGWEGIAAASVDVDPVLKRGSQQVVEEASITLDLIEGLDDRYQYCFRVPVLHQGSSEIVYYFYSYSLKEQGSVQPTEINITASSPLEGSNVPASLSFSINAEQLDSSVSKDDWHYVLLANQAECRPIDSLAWVKLDIDTPLVLSADMAGQAVCVRIKTAQGRYAVQSYQIPGATESKQDSSARWLIFAVVILFIVSGLGIAFYLRKQAASKQQD